jgi:signal peptidase I
VKAGRVGVAVAVAALSAGALSAGCLAWARRRLVLITVKGDSMAPAYRDGQRLLVRRAACRTGEVVVFRPPSPRVYDVDWMVKRAVAVAGDPVPADLSGFATVVAGGSGGSSPRVSTVPGGRLLVRSDAPDGIDSRQLGLIDDRDVLGVVCYPRARPISA